MSPDPGNAGVDPMNPESWNAYGYVNNNPMNATDPTGLATWNIGPCYFNTAYSYVDGQYQGSSTNFLGCFPNLTDRQLQNAQQESPPLPPQRVHVEQSPGKDIPKDYDVPLDSDVAEAFAKVYRTARQVKNPCTIAAFYAGSAAAGATTAINLTEVMAAAETAGIPATGAVAAFYRWASKANAAVTISKTFNRVGNAAQEFCTWMGTANW